MQDKKVIEKLIIQRIGEKETNTTDKCISANNKRSFLIIHSISTGLTEFDWFDYALTVGDAAPGVGNPTAPLNAP